MDPPASSVSEDGVWYVGCLDANGRDLVDGGLHEPSLQDLTGVGRVQRDLSGVAALACARGDEEAIASEIGAGNCSLRSLGQRYPVKRPRDAFQPEAWTQSSGTRGLRRL